MASFTSAGVALAYDDIAPPGAERTVVLVHGFASNRNEGWKRTGWYQAFERRRMRCIALDQRGHGESEKLYEPEDYAREKLAGDVVALLDHLGVGRADLFGYSMGARTTLAAGLLAPERFSNLIVGGVGGKLLEPAPKVDGNPMSDAMLAEDPSTITEPMLRSFRQFADEQGEDRRALAAMTRTANPPWDAADLGMLPMPVLVVAGARDEMAGAAEDLAAVFARAHGVTIPGCDHFSAIPHALTKAAVFDFLDGVMDEEDFPSPY